jgi:nucleotide-binding universal stress UspA family protein
MYRKILIAYEGSESARKALDTALDFAARDGAELHVLTVVRGLDIADDVETEAVIENSLAYHRKLLSEIEEPVRKRGVSARFEAVVGHPAEQIIYYADRNEVDLIVVGDRGRSKFARLLLGSVSKQVVQYADRPVLVVR